MRRCELDICDAELEERRLCGPQFREAVAEDAESLGRDGGEQPGVRAEVIPRRGVTHADVRRDCAQTQTFRSAVGHDLERTIEDGAPQVTVVVESAWSNYTPTTLRCIDCSDLPDDSGGARF